MSSQAVGGSRHADLDQTDRRLRAAFGDRVGRQVPLGELTRRYVDETGLLHQALAERCQRVIFTVAGLPMTLKGVAL